MNAPHELTTAELRAEVNYRRRRLETGKPPFFEGSARAELERGLERYEAELRRRERYDAATAERNLAFRAGVPAPSREWSS